MRARLFHALLALIFVDAFVSLGRQATVLWGERGLSPLEPALVRARQNVDLTVLDIPSVLYLFGAGDGALWFWSAVGIGAGLVALSGRWTRPSLALATVVYLGFVVVGGPFLAFQWDLLLVECGFLAVFLPRDRPARWTHLLFVGLLFKLYFESGIAKWQSHLGDWHDGSAMTYYYETAPIPTALSWYAHHLPAPWHHFESWAALVLELAVPFLAFGPRPARLFALVSLTGFQLVNWLTANYGFFVPLAVALHVFLLDERDLRWLAERTTSRLRAALRLRPGAAPGPAVEPGPGRRRVRLAVAIGVSFYWTSLSLLDGVAAFADDARWSRWAGTVAPLYRPFLTVNTYHLFGHITRERIEPDFQTRAGGGEFVSQPMRYKPGPVDRAPPFVAPHQPRVDFRLWFYGLSYGGGVPGYVRNLLASLCRDPDAVAPLFAAELPAHPEAVRIVFWRYRFSSPHEKARSGAVWTREQLGATPTLPCAKVRPKTARRP